MTSGTYYVSTMSITTNSDDITLESDGVLRNQFAFGDNDSNYKENTSIARQILQIEISKKILWILGVVSTILCVLIIIGILLSLNETNQIGELKNKDHVNLLRSIILTTDKTIWSFDVDNKKCTLLHTLNSDVVAMDTYLEETIFWSDHNTSTINSLWKSHANITHTKRLKSQAIAVDYVTNKLYLVDKASGSLAIIDMKRKNFGLVYTDLENPHDIVLDPAEGLMFVVQFYKSIIKANMDGTSLRTIVRSAKVSAIAIDRKATRIYWSNDQASIESSDYDGILRQTVIQIPMGIISLTVMDNQLFWTRASNWTDMCPCTNLIWSCSLYRRTCNNVSSHQLPFDTPRLLRTAFDQHRHLIKNPCDRNNGGCEQLCLMTSKGSHDCACNVGWTLNADGRTCANVSKLMMYVQSRYIRARIVGLEKNESFNAAIVPTRYNVNRMAKKSLIHFDYNMANDEFYFSDDLSIYRISVFKDEEQTKVLNVSDNYAIKDVVYDWTKDCIFYVRQSQDPSNNHSIVMHSFKPDVKSQKTILTSKFKKEAHIDCPHNLAIQPNHEYLFFSDYNGVNDNLRRVSTNGKGLILWKPFYSNVQLVCLAIDSERSRIYWSTSVSNSMIKSANLEGSEEETVQVANFVNASYVGVKDWLYVGNIAEIWSVKRDNGGNATRLVKMRQKIAEPLAYEVIHGLKIYSLAARNIT